MASEVEISNKGVQILDKCYASALKGLPTSESAVTLAKEYLSKNNGDVEKASKKLINAQIAKCTTTGFVTGLGGLITLPIAIPADVAGNIYVQIRMIAALAALGGYNPYDDSVKTMAYMTLVGMTVEDAIKIAGIKVGNKLALQAVKQIPGKVLVKINQRVGFRLMTKFGEKGIINLAKLVPVAGGGVGALLDLFTTKAIAARAKKAFIG
ncbi:MAG: EcsC family protein [Ruminococcus sp.]|nr:EcsC family protein [Ruminococcus sp.]